MPPKPTVPLLALAAVAATVGAFAMGKAQRSAVPAPRPGGSSASRAARTTMARQLNGSAAILALSVLTDSATEHYRGSFVNRAMYIPLAVSTLTLGASLYGIADTRARHHAGRDLVYAMAGLTGLAGLGFHAYNITKRPGGISWLNLFYAAPIGAPIALLLAGLLGRGAEKARQLDRGDPPLPLPLTFADTIAFLTAAGLAGTVGEAGLLHFRGAFHNPAMLLPVTLPPVAAGLTVRAAFAPSAAATRAARWWLRLTAALGLIGSAFHAYGVGRAMGGWRNWRQNVLNGPPLPAPPSFTGLAIAGLAALSLRQEEQDG